MKHTSIDKSGIRSKGMTKSQNVDKQQEIADRLSLICRQKVFSQDQPINIHGFGDSISVRPEDMLTTPIMIELVKEFDQCFLDETGVLVIS